MRHATLAVLHHASKEAGEALSAGVSQVLAFLHPHIGVLVLLLVIWLLYRRLEARIEEVLDTQDEAEGRLLGLEVKEYSQDERMDSLESTLVAHAKFMVSTRRDVDNLGRDVGWDDSKRKTQVMLPTTTQSLLKDIKKPE